MARVFHLPDLGEGITEAQIVRVLVAEGDHVDEDQGLFEVETDKAAVEIPSPFSGKATKIHVEEGQVVNVGEVMISFDGDGAETPAGEKKGRAVEEKREEPTERGEATPPKVVSTQASTDEPVEGTVASDAKRTTAPAAPAVRKFARELGVDIDALRGSGPGGRVTRADVEDAVGRSAAPSKADRRIERPATRAPVTPPLPPPGVKGTDKWGPVRRAPLTQIRKTIANQMIRSASTIPHVTHHDLADITELEEWRRRYKTAYQGEKRVTAMAVIIKAVAKALRNHPIFNASIDMEAVEITYRDYINVGVAVDTERGLVVPHIRNTDRLSIEEIGVELSRIAENARKVQFAIEDLRGGTFTITNYGAIGGIFGNPIINHPEVAILGVGKGRAMAVVRDGQVVARTMLPLSLAFDHRIADGAQAARFCTEIIQYLEKPVTLVF